MSDEKQSLNESLTTSHLQKTVTTAHLKQQIQNPQSTQGGGQTGQSGNGGSQPSGQEQ